MIKFQVAQVGTEEGNFGDEELALFPCGPEHETLKAAWEYMNLHARGHSSKEVSLDDYLIRIVDKDGHARHEAEQARLRTEALAEEARRQKEHEAHLAKLKKEEEEDELQAKWDRDHYGG